MSWMFKDSVVTNAWLNSEQNQSNSKKWPKKIKLLQKRFFLKKQLTKFSCTSWTLLLCKIKKKTWEQTHSYEDIPFLGQHDQIAPPPPPKNIFFKKSINITYLYLCNSFIMQNCKTILTADPELWGHTILGPKLPICPKYFFYRKAINIISMYLSAPFIVQNLKNP